MNATASLLADTICRTVELGVTITDAAVAGEFTHLFCSPVAIDPICAECGAEGRLRDHVERRVTDLADRGPSHQAARAGAAFHLRQPGVRHEDLPAAHAADGRTASEDHPSLHSVDSATAGDRPRPSPPTMRTWRWKSPTASTNG